jgi:hypothetical protein
VYETVPEIFFLIKFGSRVGWLVGLEARQLLRLFASVYHTGSVKTR